MARYRDYKVYGRDSGDTKAKARYLFTTSARSQKEAIKNGRRRVKGTSTIVRATLKYRR